jgi:AhpD family alkylhydroperoxidase
MSMNKNTKTKMLLATVSTTMLALCLAGTARAEAKRSPEATAARAEIQKMIGFVPGAFDALPDNALPGAWEEFKTLQASDTTALPCKVKEIIALSVAAQLPSPALVYGHTQIARASGASAAEISDGVAMAALARHWSTFFNGMQLDEGKFRAEIGRVLDGAKKAAASGAAPPAPINVTDAKTALADIKQSFGFVPEFINRFPAASLAGAWREMRDIEMNPTTALSGKYKSLVGLAVSSQIPCRYCIIADTEFSKLEGATDREIAEAITISGMVRHWSAFMTGLAVDEGAYRKDMARIAKGIASMTKTAASAKAGGKAAALANVK